MGEAGASRSEALLDKTSDLCPVLSSLFDGCPSLSRSPAVEPVEPGDGESVGGLAEAGPGDGESAGGLAEGPGEPRDGGSGGLLLYV